jgi:hypothetical protein
MATLPSQFQSGLLATPPVTKSQIVGFSSQNLIYQNADSSVTIRVDLPFIANTWCDPRQSAVRFTVTTSGQAEIDTNAGAVFSRIEVYSAGQSQLLSSISGYNVLNQLLFDVTASPSDTAYSYSILAGFNSVFARRGETLSANTPRTYILPLINWLGLGSNSKNWPFSGITILFTLANPAEAFISANAITYQVSNLEYLATLLELPADVHSALMMSNPNGLLIPATDWRQFVAPIGQDLTVVDTNIGVRQSSVKMLVFTLRQANTLTSTTNHVLSNRLNGGLTSWTIRVGSSFYPTRPCTGTAQFFKELLSCFHVFNTSTPTCLNLPSYQRAVIGQTNNVDDPQLKGSFASGYDFEQISHQKSDTMLAGLDTRNNVQTFLSLTFGGAHSQMQLDVFACFDLLLNFSNGTVVANG